MKYGWNREGDGCEKGAERECIGVCLIRKIVPELFISYALRYGSFLRLEAFSVSGSRLSAFSLYLT